MVKKHLKGMEIGIKEGDVEIKTLWKTTCDDETKNKLTIDFLLMAVEKVLGESVIVYKDKNGKTQFNTGMFLEAHKKDDEHIIEIKIQRMLKEALETI
jgi:hypothetical protein